MSRSSTRLHLRAKTPFEAELKSQKLLKGDGSWCTRKEILGWIIDTIRQTLELPSHRKQELVELLAGLQAKKRVAFREWQKVLGKLRFIAKAIPGSRGLFCGLQEAANAANGNRVRLTRDLKLHLATFADLAADLCNRPTYLAEIVPDEPKIVGTTDAARQGMGGVFFDVDGTPCVWRTPFPPEVQQRLVTVENPEGDITNSDLEQAGVICHLDVVANATAATAQWVSAATTPLASHASQRAPPPPKAAQAPSAERLACTNASIDTACISEPKHLGIEKIEI